MTLQWSVVRANKPQLAKKSIEQIGIDVYMPEVVVRVRKGRRHEAVKKPLLYGYLFVQIDLELDERWKLIFSRRGVEDVMCTGGRPIAVPDKQVQRVRAIAEPYENVVCDEMPLTKDQVVRIIDGAFTSFPAVVTRAKDSKGNDLANIDVEVQIFGRPTPITLPRDFVAPAA